MALKQLRKTLVPHARPVPKFDHPFQPQKYATSMLLVVFFLLHIESRVFMFLLLCILEQLLNLFFTQLRRSSKKVTKPRSPKLLILKRQERRKMACPYAAVSSAASQMR